MTREEEIQVSIEKYNKREEHDSIPAFSLFDVNSAYYEGAEWADSHPRKGLVDIEKVCEWINDNLSEYCDGECIEFSNSVIYKIDVLEQELFIKGLRKAMEE